MAVTKGAMTSLPTSQTIFVQGTEEPEHNSINFRDSLKFFQEQLVINGANFPSPSPVSRTGNDTLRKNGSRSYKEQNLDTNSKISKNNDMFESEIPSVRSCKIPIPTVDTILESVRVLRAIQKSQEERGSSWNLDVTSKPNNESEYNYTDEWVMVSDINQTECLTNESNNMNNGEINATNLKDKLETNGIICAESNGKGNKENIFSENNSQSNTPFSNTVNEICSFWPSNTLTNGTHTDNEYGISNLSFSIETKDVSSELSTLCINGDNIENKPFENGEIFGNSFDMKPKTTLDHRLGKFDLENFNQNALLGEICTENFTNEENNIETCSTPDSLRSVCKNLLDSVHEKILDNEKCSKETVLSGPESAITELKIDTYDDIDSTKHEDFLLNGSLWKENCSPNESNSAKIEHNDSDSGIGTQRSASSLSANNPNHMQKDSWSDTCSSHYASAECSPYHSLNSVFESSLGLNATQGEAKDIEYSEPSAHLISSVPENETEEFQENIKETCDEYHEVSELTEQIDREVGSVQEKIQETKEAVSEEHQEISQLPKLTESELKITQEEVQEKIIEIRDDPLGNSESLKRTNKDIDDTSNIDLTDNQFTFSDSDHECHSENAEQDAEISYCSFISNYTITNPASIRIDEESNLTVSESCDTSISNLEVVNGHENDVEGKSDNVVKTESLLSVCSREDEEDDPRDLGRIQKFTANSCDLISIVESLYTITENPAYQVISPDETEEIFKESLFILSKGAFCEHPEDDYIVIIEDSNIHITKDCRELLSLNMKYGGVSYDAKNILKIDNRLGRCIYIRCEAEEIVNLKSKIEVHCLKHWKTDCLQLVHYPLKYHQNVVIVDLGSSSTRAGILMDQPTLPSLFFPTICATDKRTGTSVYGMEALQPEVRQHSNLSFPVRPTIKITKHTIDIDLLEGLFKKVFTDLKVDPTQYTVQVCLPRNLSISAQTALVKLLLEGLNVKAVSLTNQALLTLYAHDVSTAVVVDIGDRTDVLPVVDGFIVENGVTRLPHGGQRLIHHMRHGLAEKRITLSTDIDSFVVQYIIENLAYVADDYDNELEISSRYPDIIKKTVTLQPASPENSTSKSITLEEARFKITEGLFNPDLWGLDSPGIHHLVQKAIQATSVDARKKIAENIYVSGGVTMLPGFVERLNKEVAKLSKTKIVPKVSASNYRYHCTYIGACKFAKLEVFPQVCINLEEYTENSAAALKKCALYF